MANTIDTSIINSILIRYGITENVVAQKIYIYDVDTVNYIKVIFRVSLESGKMLVIKIVREEDNLPNYLQKAERQCIFSEFMRSHGIITPTRYQANGKYCTEYVFHKVPCAVIVEDWCGEECAEITTDLAWQIGKLMAQMHTISLNNHCRIGSTTLFSAVSENDVDVFPEFCEFCKDKNINQAIASQIIELHDNKISYLRTVWNTLPQAAVQGDISVNNLVLADNALKIFDYNNAGDEVLVSDLVIEGLLTAYEMDIPDGVVENYRAQIFPKLIKGYLSVRPLSDAEKAAAWEIYTLYNALWFSKVVYNETSLEKLIETQNYDAANLLLTQMLKDISAKNSGLF